MSSLQNITSFYSCKSLPFQFTTTSHTQCLAEAPQKRYTHRERERGERERERERAGQSASFNRNKCPDYESLAKNISIASSILAGFFTSADLFTKLLFHITYRHWRRELTAWNAFSASIGCEWALSLSLVRSLAVSVCVCLCVNLVVQRIRNYDKKLGWFISSFKRQR